MGMQQIKQKTSMIIDIIQEGRHSNIAQKDNDLYRAPITGRSSFDKAPIMFKNKIKTKKSGELTNFKPIKPQKYVTQRQEHEIHSSTMSRIDYKSQFDPEKEQKILENQQKLLYSRKADELTEYLDNHKKKTLLKARKIEKREVKKKIANMQLQSQFEEMIQYDIEKKIYEVTDNNNILSPKTSGQFQLLKKEKKIGKLLWALSGYNKLIRVGIEQSNMSLD